MIYRTLLEAQREPGPFASWKQKVIMRVTLRDGRTFFRTYVFDTSIDPCKRCRGARRQLSRIPCTGHVCERCGNPFAGFIRQSRTRRSGTWEGIPNCYGSSGRNH